MSLPDDVFEAHKAAGVALFTACSGEVFPCDALAFAVLDRSLGLNKGFRVLSANGGYASAMALLRLQLDSALRLRGVIASDQPHEVADQMFGGKHLRDIKDKAGHKMTDRHLLRELMRSAPWVEQVYDLCSGYIHLSGHHISYFLSRCVINGEGKREFAIGEEDDHISDEAKHNLEKAFEATTKGLIGLVRVWCEVRDNYGTNTQLKLYYRKSP